MYQKLCLKIVCTERSNGRGDSIDGDAGVNTFVTCMDVYGTWNREIREEYDNDNPNDPGNDVVHDGGIYWYYELAPEYYKELTENIMHRPYDVQIHVNDVRIEDRDFEISEDNMYIYGIWSEEYNTYKPTIVCPSDVSLVDRSFVVPEYESLMRQMDSYFSNYAEKCGVKNVNSAEEKHEISKKSPKKTASRWIILPPMVDGYNGRWRRGLRLPIIVCGAK